MKKIPHFSEYFVKKFVNSSLNSYNILGERFANSWRTVALKTKRTIMNTSYPNSSQTLFERLFASRIARTQTPEIYCGLKPCNSCHRLCIQDAMIESVDTTEPNCCGTRFCATERNGAGAGRGAVQVRGHQSVQPHDVLVLW